MYEQFALVRYRDRLTYLTRFWLVDTPLGGIALHRMTAPDARDVLHDHPFGFVSFVVRGGYIEDRLNTRTMRVETRIVDKVNRVRPFDAHTITHLLRVPTWTLLLVGRPVKRWGFLWRTQEDDRVVPLAHVPSEAEWLWQDADAFDSGHYLP